MISLPATIMFRKWGIQMEVPAEKHGVAKLLYAFHEYYDDTLPHLLARLSKSDTFVDVGANYGIYSMAAAPRVQQVIAFEPWHEAFDVLCTNIRVNKLKNVVPYCTALSDQAGTGRLYCSVDSSRNSLGDWDETCATETVKVETLSKVLYRIGAERLDVIKIDVEGAEELVLRGGREILVRHRPVILFEMNAKAAIALGLDPQGAANFLKSLGYEFFCFGRDGELLQVTDSYPWNVVAMHPGSCFREKWVAHV